VKVNLEFMPKLLSVKSEQIFVITVYFYNNDRRNKCCFGVQYRILNPTTHSEQSFVIPSIVLV
jgi:hypothetical protein